MARISMATLTEQQRALLVRAARYGRATTEWYGGRGPDGGRVASNVRLNGVQAAHTLCKRGLLTLESSDSSMHAVGNGNTGWVYTARWTLTPTGRAIVES